MGMQDMLLNLVKNAAPDIVEKVDNVAAMAVAFKQQLDRIEVTQIELFKNVQKLLEAQNGRTGKDNQGISATLNGAGKQTTEPGDTGGIDGGAGK